MAGFLDVLNQTIGGVGNIVGGVENIFKKLGISPQTAAGLGLTAAGASQAGLPGYATDAVQFLRNQFTSPTALSEDLTGQLQGLADRFQPLLTQQRQLDLGDIQQRYATAFPTSVGAQPSEFKGLADYITHTALPREQGLLTNLGLGLVERQSRSAEDLLNFAKPNPLAEALGNLGGLLTFSDLLRGRGTGQEGGGGDGVGDGSGSGGRFGGRGSGGGAGRFPPSGSPGGMFGGISGDLFNQLLSAVGRANTTGDTQALEALLVSGQLQGIPFPFGVDATTPAGQIMQQAINRGLMESPAAQRLTGLSVTGGGESAGGGIPGLAGLMSGKGFFGAPGLSSGAGLISGIGSVVAPGLTGYALGRNLKTAPNAAIGALEGAGAGALEGFAIGGPVGAVIGTLAGAVGDVFARSTANKAQKESFRRQDLDSQASQVQEIGSFFTQALSKLGVDTTDFQKFVSQKIAESPGPGDEQSMVAAEGGRLLLQATQRAFPQVKTLNDVPGLRAQYVDFLIRNTFSASNSRFGGGPALDLIEGTFSTAAGFS